MSKTADKTAALEAERDLLRESLAETLTTLRDLEQKLADLRQEADAQARNRADRHILKAMNELLELQLDTEKDRRAGREGVLGRLMLDDAARIREQAQEIEALREELARIQNSRSWRLTAPLRSARDPGRR